MIRLPHGTRSVHVMPKADLVEHAADADCACGPTPELVETADCADGWVYTHHSLDGREANERRAS